MKRLIYTILLVLPLMLSSQNMYNITDILDNSPSGTARFISMGGSMGALGGDISVMGINPAGTAVYRSSDFNLTGAFNLVRNNATFEGQKFFADYTGADLSNLGFVIAVETKETPVKYLNFGVNFHRKRNFCNNFSMNGASGDFSQQYVIDELYKQDVFNLKELDSWMYSDFEYNWLALLAADAQISDKEGNFLLNPDRTLIYNPDRFGYYSETRGDLGVWDFNFSANIDDRVYLGATLGYYKLDYSRYSYYYEEDEIDKIYTLENNYRVVGTGYDFKFGAIFRPFKYSPFKIATFLHTPVFYKLLDCYSASMYGPYGDGYETNSKECYGDDLYLSYSLRTPWRFGAAMSYTFGKYVALNAEYEFSNLSETSFTDGADADMAQNEEISYNLQAQHTVRVGAELSLGRLVQKIVGGTMPFNLSLRAGYNFISSPFKPDAYKCLDNATITDTSTEYINKFDKNVVTFGLGYAGKRLYIDVAYMFKTQQSEFYPYYDTYSVNPATKVRTSESSLVAGIGIRF